MKPNSTGLAGKAAKQKIRKRVKAHQEKVGRLRIAQIFYSESTRPQERQVKRLTTDFDKLHESSHPEHMLTGIPAERIRKFSTEYSKLEATSEALLAKEVPLEKRAAQLAKKDAEIRRNAREILGVKEEAPPDYQTSTKAQRALMAADMRRRALLVVRKDAERHKRHWEGK